MPAPSVTYTFSNSTTADATQVNQNFTDLVNGITDGTKDLSISALTCAGNVSFNGNVTLGNASGDDVTFTGSLASSIPIKTHNSFDIGSVTTLGLRALYFASSSATKTAKLQGPAVASDVTLTLPAYTGTLRNIPAVSSVQTTTYSISASDELVLVSGASGAFSATLPTAAGVAGKVYTIKRTDQTLANAVTIATTSSQTIDGATSRKLTTQYEEFTVVSDGSNWHTISHTYPQGWVSFTPTGAWSSNTTYTGFWRRTGESVNVRVKVATTGAPTSATLTINMPTSMTIDTSKMPTHTAQVHMLPIGIGHVEDAGSATFMASVMYLTTTSVQINVSTASGSYVDPSQPVTQAAPMTWGSGDSVIVSWDVPLTNWEA